MQSINLGSDIKKSHTMMLLGVIIIAYVGLAIPELSDPKDWPDYDFFGPTIQQWDPTKITAFDYHVKYALAKFSIDYLGNPKIMPLVVSVAFVMVTYLFAVQLSGKKYAGVIAAAVIVASNVWRDFDTSAVHGYDWALFFMASLYMIKRKWYLNPVFFVLSIFCKSLAVLFLPITIYMIIKSDLALERKLILGSVYGVLSIGFMLASTYLGDYSGLPFNAMGFMYGSMDWLYFLVVPDFWMAALMPVSMFLLLALAAKGIKNTGIVFAAMLNLSLYGAFLQGFTDDMWNEPYRYAPLIAMFGCSIGVIINGISLRVAQKKEIRTDLGKL